MNDRYLRSPLALSAALLGVGLAGMALPALAQVAAAPASGRAAQPVAAATLPGGAVISAKSVLLAPLAGGDGFAVPIAGDGSFHAVGLPPGRYRLMVSSTPVAKQTQGATFGEKVNAGLHAAGGAVATGVGSRHETAKNSIGNIRGREAAPPPATSTPPAGTASKDNINGGMPNRISMNVTVPRQSLVLDVDGAPAEVDVDQSGRLAGQATPR